MYASSVAQQYGNYSKNIVFDDTRFHGLLKIVTMSGQCVTCQVNVRLMSQVVEVDKRREPGQKLYRSDFPHNYVFQ